MDLHCYATSNNLTAVRALQDKIHLRWLWGIIKNQGDQVLSNHVLKMNEALIVYIFVW
jgi:hypothetical protein